MVFTGYASGGSQSRPFEWVQKDGEMFWDDRVTDDASAKRYYGEGATHRAPGYTYTSGTSGYDPNGGEVVLGEDRKFTRNGVSYTAENSTPSLINRGFEAIDHFVANSHPVDFVKSKSSDVASGFVYVFTAVGSSVGNAANTMWKEGIHGGAPYDWNNYCFSVYKLDNWKLKTVVDYKTNFAASTGQLQELGAATISVVASPLKVVNGTGMGSRLLNTGVKSAITYPIKLGITSE